MSMAHYVHGRSDPGKVRGHNEDSFRISRLPDGATLLVVCDGMGGHEAGEVASAIAADRIVEVVKQMGTAEPPRVLYTALTEANAAVLAASTERPSAAAMGTTGTVALVKGEECWVGNVGDSRFYQLRAGAIVDRTQDHTRVGQMVAQGILSPADAKKHPHAHILIQALGGGPEAQVSFKPEVWTEPLRLQAGDVLLLCSDGLHDLVEDPELYPLVAGHSYEAAVDPLVNTALERGGFDNVTVVLLVAGQPEIPALEGAPRAQEPVKKPRETAQDIPLPLVSAPPPPEPEKPAPQSPRLPERRQSVPPVVEGEEPKRRAPVSLLLAVGGGALLAGLVLGFVGGRARVPVCPPGVPTTLGVPAVAPAPAAADAGGETQGGDAGQDVADASAPSSDAGIPTVQDGGTP